MAKAKMKTPVQLSEKEKMVFAKAVFDARKADPQMGWKPIFAIARQALPKGTMSEHLDHPNKLPWVKPLLDKLAVDAAPFKHRSSFTDEDRIQFAKYVFELRKNNPAGSIGSFIQGASKMMPKDKQVGTHMNSFNQIAWIKPLLDQLEKNSKTIQSARTPGLSKQTDEEKEQFAKTVYSLRKGGSSWTSAMREANNYLPEGHKLADSVINPSAVPWLQRALAKLENADKNKVSIDHRGILPKEDYVPEFKKERKHSETKTYWNKDEKLFFAEVAYQLKICNPGWGWQKILDEANKEMPGHKQRPKMPPSPSQMPWLNSLLDKVAKRPPEKREPEPVKLPEIAAPAPTTIPTFDMQAMMQAALEKVAREHFALMHGTAPSVVAQASVQPEKQQKKKVVVVGLLNEKQTSDTQRDFGRVFDFKFITANTPSQQIKDAARHADIAIAMTQFISHSTQAALRGHPGFNFCNGNSSALKVMLQEKIDRMAGQ